MRTIIPALLLALALAACNGEEPVVPTDPTPDEPAGDWTPPPCGERGDQVFDRTAAYSGGSLRLCVRETEVRLWALTDKGKPDSGFHKSQADVFFTPGNGEEQLINGILLKGAAPDGFATRLAGHGGQGVTSAHVTFGDEDVKF